MTRKESLRHGIAGGSATIGLPLFADENAVTHFEKSVMIVEKNAP